MLQILVKGGWVLMLLVDKLIHFLAEAILVVEQDVRLLLQLDVLVD